MLGQHTHWIKKTLIASLVVFFGAGSLLFAAPQKAHAQNLFSLTGGVPFSTFADTGQNDKTTTTDNQQSDSCVSGALAWIVCPTVTALQTAVIWFNNAIMSLLHINTGSYFDINDSNNKTAQAYYGVWSAFRYVALSALIIIGLIMVISQAIGASVFDAYTIKKLMPRIVVAVILISLSWQLTRYAIDITNAIGDGIRTLIYYPFIHSGLGNPDSLNNNLTETTTGIATSWAAIPALFLIATALGPIGLLFVIGGIFLAVLTAFIVLIFRQILVIFLVTVVPIALVANILPGTQKVWKMWSDNFMKMMLLFPLIAGFIAIGHVFALSASSSTGFAGALGAIIFLIAYFGPYFVLPKLFQMSGSLMGMAAGAITSAGRAGYGRAFKGAHGQASKRHEEIHSGKRNPYGSSAFGKIYRRTTNPHGWVPFGRANERYKMHEEMILQQATKEAAEKDAGRTLMDDNVTKIAMKAASYSEFVKNYMAKMGVSEEIARSTATSLEINTGLKFGSDAMKAAAFKATVASKTGYDTGTAGLQALSGDIQYALEHELMSKNDIYQAVKSNRARPDLSAASFGTLVSFVNKAESGSVTNDDLEAYQMAAFEGARPDELAMAHPNAVKSLTDTLQHQVEKHAASGDTQKLVETYAFAANIYDVMSRTNPKDALVIKEKFMSQNRPTGPKAGSADAAYNFLHLSPGLSNQQIIERLRNHPEFLQLRREYGSRYGFEQSNRSSGEPDDL